MTLPDAPAARHRAVAGTFTERAEGVSDWDAPAPVAGWTARDVVIHLVEWFPAFLAQGGEQRLSPGPDVATDPLGAWRHQADAVQALLDDPDVAASSFAHPYLPEQPLGAAVTAYYTSDVFMHTWDLARATGQDERLDPDLCGDLLAGMRQMEDVLRGSGQYGPAVPIADDADVQTRMLGFIGRDPHWRATRPEAQAPG